MRTADKYIARDGGPPIVTPRDLPAAPLLEDHAKKRERWPQWLKDTFNHARPVSVWVGGSRATISCTVNNEDGTVIRFGHNRPSRPLRVGCSGSWADTVTNRMDQVPFWWQGLLARAWTPDAATAKRLAEAMANRLSALGDLAGMLQEPVNDFIDGWPDFAIDELEAELLATAKRANIQAWDDDGLVAHLTAQHNRWLRDTASKHRRTAR